MAPNVLSTVGEDVRPWRVGSRAAIVRMVFGAPTDRLDPLDDVFLRVEDGLTHMHIGCCAVFDGPVPGPDEVLELLADRLSGWRGYRRRLRATWRHRGRPEWVDDDSFELTDHVHHVVVPAPGGDEELDALVGRLMSVELDRRHPLWEAWMVHGLVGGRWALVSKVHHCLVDGVAGADLLARVLDATPDRAPPPLPTASTSGHVEASIARGPHRRWRAIQRLAPTGGQRPRDVVTATRHVLTGSVAVSRRLRPQPMRLSIDGAIGPRRRWAVARCTLDEVATIRAVFGATVNDIAMAVVAGAFRDLLVSRGDRVDGASMRCLVPVSVRPPDDHTADNQIGALLADLPVARADPAERLVSIQREMSQLKRSHQADATRAMTLAVGVMPEALFSVGVRAGTSVLRHVPQRSVHTVITNVPGPQVPLYALGRQMLEVLPCVPIIHGLRIGVAVLSYNGQLRFGTTGDFDTVPEVAWFCGRIEAGLAELRDRASMAVHHPR